MVRKWLTFAAIWSPVAALMVLTGLFPWFAKAIQIPLYVGAVASLSALTITYVLDRRVRRQVARATSFGEPGGGAYVVIDGHQFPILRIRLSDGVTQLVYEVRGPLPALSGSITVFGDDGRGVWQGGVRNVPELADGEVWTVSYRMQTTNVVDGEVTLG